jgi:CBS domain-containing protein
MKVKDHMSKRLVFVPERMSAGSALAAAREKNVHYLLVVDPDNDLSGITCLCKIARMPVSDAVGSTASSPVTYVTPDDSLEQAAQVMHECSVGCLPVVEEPGRVIGVITRHDLRALAVLSADDTRRCAACGASHDLVGVGLNVPFCSSCLESTPPPGTVERSLYCTLGGGD